MRFVQFLHGAYFLKIGRLRTLIYIPLRLKPLITVFDNEAPHFVVEVVYGWKRYSAVGCMTEATTTLTRAGAEHLLADKGYDSDAIVEQATAQSMSVVIPPRKNRKEQRSYDKHLYRQRHLVENAFLHLKRWRGIATRYAKNAASFLAAVHIRCLVLWLVIS